MRAALIVLCAVAGLGLVWAGASAQQEVFRTPGPGSGTMTVRGTVDIGNVPDVMATQRGEWRVAVSSAPPVVVNGPTFVATGGRYTIAWPNGEMETVSIVDPGQGGWAQVTSPGEGRRRWVNLGVAVAMEEAR